MCSDRTKTLHKLYIHHIQNRTLHIIHNINAIQHCLWKEVTELADQETEEESYQDSGPKQTLNLSQTTSRNTS